MARLDRVKSWMSFFGWTANGGPGSVLLGANGELVAVHGSAKWERDVMAACIRDERDQHDEKSIEEIAAGLQARESE